MGHQKLLKPLKYGTFCIFLKVVPKNAKKGVFISSTAWHGTNYTILESLIKKSNLEYCVIITLAHVSIHHLLLWGSRESNDLEVLQKIEEDVLGWMGNVVRMSFFTMLLIFIFKKSKF